MTHRYPVRFAMPASAFAALFLAFSLARAESPVQQPSQSLEEGLDSLSSEAVALSEGDPTRQLSDLTLGNFFSDGWNESWAKRQRTTPDMALLRVTTNFLEREFRFDYVRTDTANNAKFVATDLANALIAYGLNRRLMIEVIANYQWNIPPGNGFTTNGPGGGLLARFQLVDTATASYSFQAKVAAPNKGLGQTQTSMTYALAGWQDMHAVVPALGRFGLYYSFQYENLLGPHKVGATVNDVTYDVSLAETWTSPSTPVFGNFTTFVEGIATTNLDGASSGKTAVSITPGIRFWFVPENSFTFGVDLPLTSAPTFHSVFRATYIMNF